MKLRDILLILMHVGLQNVHGKSFKLVHKDTSTENTSKQHIHKTEEAKRHLKDKITNDNLFKHRIEKHKETKEIVNPFHKTQNTLNSVREDSGNRDEVESVRIAKILHGDETGGENDCVYNCSIVFENGGDDGINLMEEEKEEESSGQLSSRKVDDTTNNINKVIEEEENSGENDLVEMDKHSGAENSQHTHGGSHKNKMVPTSTNAAAKEISDTKNKDKQVVVMPQSSVQEGTKSAVSNISDASKYPSLPIPQMIPLPLFYNSGENEGSANHLASNPKNTKEVDDFNGESGYGELPQNQSEKTLVLSGQNIPGKSLNELGGKVASQLNKESVHPNGGGKKDHHHHHAGKKIAHMKKKKDAHSSKQFIGYKQGDAIPVAAKRDCRNCTGNNTSGINDTVSQFKTPQNMLDDSAVLQLCTDNSTHDATYKKDCFREWLGKINDMEGENVNFKEKKEPQNTNKLQIAVLEFGVGEGESTKGKEKKKPKQSKEFQMDTLEFGWGLGENDNSTEKKKSKQSKQTQNKTLQLDIRKGESSNSEEEKNATKSKQIETRVSEFGSGEDPQAAAQNETNVGETTTDYPFVISGGPKANIHPLVNSKIKIGNDHDEDLVDYYDDDDGDEVKNTTQGRPVYSSISSKQSEYNRDDNGEETESEGVSGEPEAIPIRVLGRDGVTGQEDDDSEENQEDENQDEENQEEEEMEDEYSGSGSGEVASDYSGDTDYNKVDLNALKRGETITAEHEKKPKKADHGESASVDKTHKKSEKIRTKSFSFDAGELGDNNVPIVVPVVQKHAQVTNIQAATEAPRLKDETKGRKPEGKEQWIIRNVKVNEDIKAIINQFNAVPPVEYSAPVAPQSKPQAQNVPGFSRNAEANIVATPNQAQQPNVAAVQMTQARQPNVAAVQVNQARQPNVAVQMNQVRQPNVAAQMNQARQQQQQQQLQLQLVQAQVKPKDNKTSNGAFNFLKQGVSTRIVNTLNTPRLPSQALLQPNAAPASVVAQGKPCLALCLTSCTKDCDPSCCRSTLSPEKAFQPGGKTVTAEILPIPEHLNKALADAGIGPGATAQILPTPENMKILEEAGFSAGVTAQVVPIPTDLQVVPGTNLDSRSSTNPKQPQTQTPVSQAGQPAVAQPESPKPNAMAQSPQVPQQTPLAQQPQGIPPQATAEQQAAAKYKDPTYLDIIGRSDAPVKTTQQQAPPAPPPPVASPVATPVAPPVPPQITPPVAKIEESPAEQKPYDDDSYAKILAELPPDVAPDRPKVQQLSQYNVNDATRILGTNPVNMFFPNSKRQDPLQNLEAYKRQQFKNYDGNFMQDDR